jgi:Acyl-CoA reductase (LuxC)
MAEEYRARNDGRLLHLPRGLVFHVPPANVQTIFIYSWVMALLAGNRNVVRLSRRDSPQTLLLCRLLREILSNASQAVRDSSLMIQYGHEPEITAAISQACDVRVIWGGDAAVEAVRAAPLPAQAKEITFADRFSLCALRAEAVLEESEVDDLAARFYNDTFWFDQMACSSPRLVLWCGGGEDCRRASERFYRALERTIAGKGYDAGVGARLNQFTFACRAVVDGHASAYQEYGGLCVLRGARLDHLPREHCGAGLLYHYEAPGLEAMDGFVTRREQTLTYFGFAREEMLALAVRLNGRGIDRMVPVGQALSFQRHWDGYDLLGELMREVWVD